MKKILLIMFCMIFLIGTVAAADWDNKLFYSENDLKVTLRNSFLGIIPTGEIGTAELKSHPSVDHIREVRVGDRIVMWYDLDFYIDYENGLGIPEFTDVRTGGKVNRNWRYVYWKNDIESFIDKNGTEQKIDNSQWLPYDSKNIQKGKIRIGIEVNVLPDDYIDGIWIIGGKRLSKHAEWTASSEDAWTYALGTFDTIAAGNKKWINCTATEYGIITNVRALSGNSGDTEPITITIFQNGDVLASKTGNFPSAYTYNVRFDLSDYNNNDRVISPNLDSGNFQIRMNRSGSGGMRIADTALSHAGSLFTATNQKPFRGDDAGQTGNITYQQFTCPGGTITTNGQCSEGINITLLYPTNNTNFTTNTITLNGTVITFTKSINISNVSLLINGSIIQTNTSGYNGTGVYTFEETLPDGNYNWTIQAYGNNSVQYNASETLFFNIDTLAPQVSITYPNETIINFHRRNTNLSLNWTIVEGSLDSCWYDYNGTNISVTCSDNSVGINITDYFNRNVTLWANDTFGKYNSSFAEWNYTIFENNQTFSNDSFEGSLEIFVANITAPETIKLANFIYNKTSYTGTISSSGNDTILEAEVIIPNVKSNTNLTFYWQVTSSDNQIINLTEFIQTIYPISLDDCAINSIVLYNYTIVDEGNQSLLSNTTAELNLNILDPNRENYVINFSEEYSEINPFAVCINKNISSLNYLVDSVVKYESIGYSIEYYNIANATISSSTIPEEITLYDLFSNDATEFKITFKDEDYQLIEDALIYIDRQYISENNTFKTVELPKTDSNGQTIGHFVRNDVVYNIRAIKNGEVLGNFRNIIAFCEDYTIGNCQINLEAIPEDTETFNYDSELGIIFQSLPSYNENTSVISFDFSTDDGTTKTIVMGVTRNDIFGNRTICNDTLTSSSGTLTCSVNPNIDESILNVNITVDGTPILFSHVRIDSSNYGNVGYIFWFVITFAYIFFFAHSKTGVLIGILVSFIGAISLGITRGDLVGIGSAGIWVLVIVIIGIIKLNKEKPQ